MSLTINYQLNLISAGANASLDLSNNASIAIARGTTSSRPNAPAGGAIRFNLDTNCLEYWNNTFWVSTSGFDSVNGTANTMPWFAPGTTVGVPVVPAITPLTQIGRNILASADAPTVLGVIGAAGTALPNNWTGAQFAPLDTISNIGGAVVVDFTTGNNFMLSLATASVAFSDPNAPNIGQSGIIFVRQSQTAAQTITWGNNWKFPGGTDFVIPADLGSYHLVSYFVVATDFIACTSVKSFA